MGRLFLHATHPVVHPICKVHKHSEQCIRVTALVFACYPIWYNSKVNATLEKGLSMGNDLEAIACTPERVNLKDFNPNADLPYGLTIEHLYKAMNEFVEFLGFLNQSLYSKHLPRLESLLMPANFSSIVGEFMKGNIPKYCPTLATNRYHNGHPDLIPKGRFPGNSVQHAEEGIEVKASRYDRGWQGHNPENTWLMVFVFDSNKSADSAKGVKPKPFRFKMVIGARLTKEDWSFSGRSGASRRTITASVIDSGRRKMMENWIYKNPVLP